MSKTKTKNASPAQALVAALTRAVKVLPRRSIVPIFNYVRIRIAGGAVIIDATDADIYLSETVSSHPGAMHDGVVCVDCREALAAAKTAAKLNDTRIGSEGPGFRIGPVVLDASAFSADDYPAAPQFKGEPVTLELFDWPAACAAVRHCASSEETRYYLRGVLIRTRGDGAPADIVATDGHRLARYAIDARGPAMSIIVPNDALDLLADMASCATDGDILHAHINGRSVVAKLIAATYPAYERVIPLKESNGKTVIASSVIRADAMADAATLACGLFSKGKDGRAVKWVGETLFARDTALPCPGAAPPAALEVGFDPLYLRDMARTFKGGLADCYASDNGSPFLFERGNLQYVVMPKRV